MKQTVLILGGSGKIGSRATDAFWERTIPQITTQVIAAAKTNGATVILPGNIYNFGDQPGVLDETTPQTAQTCKGRVQIGMEQAYKNAGVQTIILRADNFIDPAGNGDMLIMRKIAKDKITTAADPHVLQAYAYVPDWARAAVKLAEQRAALAQFEDIPFPGHAFTATDLHQCVQAHRNWDIKINRFPWWIMTLLSPFWELARKMREIRYLYQMPHRIGSDKFNRLLPDFRPNDPVDVILAGIPAVIHPGKKGWPRGHPPPPPETHPPLNTERGR